MQHGLHLLFITTFAYFSVHELRLKTVFPLIGWFACFWQIFVFQKYIPVFIDNIVGIEILAPPISTHSCQKCWHIFSKNSFTFKERKWKLLFLSATKLVSSLTRVLFFTFVTSKQVHKTFAIT